MYIFSFPRLSVVECLTRGEAERGGGSAWQLSHPIRNTLRRPRGFAGVLQPVSYPARRTADNRERTRFFPARAPLCNDRRHPRGNMREHSVGRCDESKAFFFFVETHDTAQESVQKGDDRGPRLKPHVTVATKRPVLRRVGTRAAAVLRCRGSRKLLHTFALCDS